jgi:hypothetical protein
MGLLKFKEFHLLLAMVVMFYKYKLLVYTKQPYTFDERTKKEVTQSRERKGRKQANKKI